MYNPSRLLLESCVISDIGNIRPNNEDSYLQLTNSDFFAIADGMGGHNGGEVASQITIDELSTLFLQNRVAPKFTLNQASGHLKELIFKVNRSVHFLSQMHKPLHEMGTTLCCLYFHKKSIIYAHVGDSRIYLFRDQRLIQLTKDHSLNRHVITKAIGPKPTVEPTINISRVKQKDIYLMCSDGLSDYVSHKEIEAKLIESQSLNDASKLLLSAAYENRSRDNITICLIRVV